MTDTVLTERQGDVLVIRLNDPPAMNALNPEMARKITGIMGDLPDGVRAVVFAGSERVFCAGANLWGDNQVDMSSPDFDGGEFLHVNINPMMQSIKDSKVPVLSAVHGAAIGVGAAIALASDIVIAGAGAFFVPAFTQVGLAPDSGMPFLLARSVGRMRAMELMLMAERLPAAKALEWGLITRVVEDSAVETTVMELAAKLARGATKALAMTRKEVWAGATLNFEDELKLESRVQRDIVRTKDFWEGMAAFSEKRPPRFTGS